MKKCTSILSFLVLLGIASHAQVSYSDPTSNTNTSSKTLFSTDVDDFMDVNSWQGVSEQTQKLFAFTGFYSNRLQFGFAKNFNDLYTGLYFNGAFSQLAVTKGDSGDTLDFGKSNTTGGFDIALLFGKGDLGVKIGGTVAPEVENSETDTETTKKDNSVYELFTSLGYNTELFGLPAAPYVTVGYYFGKHYTETKTAGIKTETYTATNYDTAFIEAGSGFDLGESDGLSRSFSIALADYLRFYPDDLSKVAGTVVSKQDRTFNTTSLTPKYTIKYAVDDSLSLGLKASLPVSFEIDKEKEADKSELTFAITPNLYTGLQYLATEKLTLNGGVSVSLNNLFSFVHKTAGDNSDNTFKIFSDSLWVSLSTGFSYAFRPGVVLDTTYNIISSTAGSYTTSLDSIWNTSLGLQLSIRL